MQLLITRPQPDAQTQALALSRLGHDVVVAPLFELEFLNPGRLPMTDVQALVVTSRNALRALVRLDEFRPALRIPLFAVGAATAKMARELGFQTIIAGGGTAEALMQEIVQRCPPDAGEVMHLAGEKKAWNLKGALQSLGYFVEEPVVYKSIAVESLPESAAHAISSGTLDGVVLMSPRTARTYAALVNRAGLAENLAQVTHYCLSSNIAAELDALPGARIAVTSAPDQDELLALIGRDATN